PSTTWLQRKKTWMPGPSPGMTIGKGIGLCGFGFTCQTAQHRHCERSEAIHVTTRERLDCFVAVAPRNDAKHRSAFPRHAFARVLHLLCPSEPQRAQGK